jgi:hypothetical protein
MMELDLIWIRGCSWMATMDFVKRGCEQKLLRGFTSGSNSASFVPSTPAGEEDALTVSPWALFLWHKPCSGIVRQSCWSQSRGCNQASLPGQSTCMFHFAHPVLID